MALLILLDISCYVVAKLSSFQLSHWTMLIQEQVPMVNLVGNLL